jgi:hypothetical protein
MMRSAFIIEPEITAMVNRACSFAYQEADPTAKLEACLVSGVRRHHP